MLTTIAQHINQLITSFPDDDAIILNNQRYPLNKVNYTPITASSFSSSPIAFVDGGQTEILAAGNFCLSFIRIFAQVFNNNQKTESFLNEFYLFTQTVLEQEKLVYTSMIFPLQEKLISEQDLTISSVDQSIRTGNERAPIAKVISMARRFAELALASKITASSIILDGTLEATYPNEEKYVQLLPSTACALAKSSSLFTAAGNSPTILLSKHSPGGCWSYQLTSKTAFVKLHPAAKHIFRFEGDPAVLPSLVQNSSDALFLGYPYGLMFVDRMARVSNEEKKLRTMQFLAKQQNKDLAVYLANTNAHNILDSLG
ncbi:MAG TPA: hypothetical protein VJC39_05635 [Candidatus Nanoarchaeia archaeon]|nr:hypothetical protein [Candidatus Nanoarchaeia archaeon]